MDFTRLGTSMPTDIDFYLLPCNSIDECGTLICRLIEKAYNQKHKIFVYTASAEHTQKFNDLLWTFRDISFVPHPGPVQINHTVPTQEYNDILINLTPDPLNFYTNFKRILEIIPNNPELKTAGRKKYKYYQAEGCKILARDITHTGNS
jgi:DNA polymerase-3 subunit chi